MILRTRKEKVAFGALRWFVGATLAIIVSLALVLVGFRAQKFHFELWLVVIVSSSFQLWWCLIVSLLVGAVVVKL